MHTACVFLLLALCHPTRTNATLFAVDSALSETDVYTTFHGARGGYETDPLARPFVKMGQPAAASLAVLGDLGLADLGEKMRRSPRWYRHVWWFPQVAIAGAHAWGIQHNLRNH